MGGINNMKKRRKTAIGLSVGVLAAVIVLAAVFAFLTRGINVKSGQANVVLKEDKLLIGNDVLSINYDISKGTYDFNYGEKQIIGYLEASVVVDGRTYITGAAKKRSVIKEKTKAVEDAFGNGVTVAVDNDFDDVHILQYFTVYEDKPYAILQTEVEGKKGDVSTNHISPATFKMPEGACQNIDIGKAEDMRVLFVPFDNDKWVRYESNIYSMAHKSYEVTAVYNAVERQGLVIGSVDHDTWKTAIDIQGEKEGITYLEVYGGAADDQTRDTQPHGFVSGRTVKSPRIFMGMFEDYRKGLEEYGKANAALVKPLEWNEGAIFGWNSWYAASNHIDADTFLNAANFIKQKLQPEGFGSDDGAVYINFDSFWDNLSERELIDAVEHVHAQGQKAGIYWTPFVYWGSDPLWPVEGGEGATYGEILLKDKDGNTLPAIAGGLPIDPTHPAQIKRMEYQLGKFVEWGFDYIKLDFLTHGALEGEHYDKSITTGIQAYNYGMQKLSELLSEEKAVRPIFISESIAPLFPYQYAHARRISCDVFNELKDSEYMLNAMTYGWWQKELYPFLDGDMMCLHKRDGGVFAKYEEALMRVNSNAVTGGLFLSGDNFNYAAAYKAAPENLPGTPEAVERSLELLTNKYIVDIINNKKAFLPVEGNKRNGASDIFVLQEGDRAYIAVFNYSIDKSKTMDVDLGRAGLDAKREYEVLDIWSGSKTKASGSLHVELAPGGSTIFILQ